MPTYRLTLEYEGTRYSGWQEQKNARTVAGELRRAVEEAGAIPEMFNDVVAAWRKGELEKIDALLAGDLRREYPEVYEELIVKRNQAWLPQIETMLQSEPVEFVLVGVGHMASEDGLLAELKERGFDVEPVSATK